MRIDKMRRRNRGWTWTVATAIAVLSSVILWGWGSVAPAAAQSAPTDSGRISTSPFGIPSSPELPYRVFLPLVLGGSGSPSAPRSAFGIQLYSDPSTASAALPLAKQAQVSWIRYPVSWRSIQPTNTTPAQYRFNGLDWALGAIPGSGLNLIATINGNPSWAAEYLNGPIYEEYIDEFAQFTGALVERYDGDGWQDAPGPIVVDYWELYNEPDSGSISGAVRGAAYWGDFGAEYARMSCAVYPVMKAANPGAKIVMGGIAYDWFEPSGPFVPEFLDNVLGELREMRQVHGQECLDVMNFHYYPPFEASWSQYGSGVVGKANFLRSELDLYGFGALPLIATEAGYHSNNASGFPSTPEIQADYVVKLFTQSLAARLGVMIWFTWSDYEIDYQFANGLLDKSLQPKRAYYAYQVAAGKLGAAVFQRIPTSSELGGADVQGYLFDRGGPLYVLWSDRTPGRSVDLPGRSARVIDQMGILTEQIADGDGDGQVAIPVGPSPIYVEVVP